MLQKELKTKVVNYCNRNLVLDSTYTPDSQFHSEWFVDYFSFLPENTERIGAERIGATERIGARHDR